MALSTVQALLPEAFVAAVITDAVDVRSVVHLGRQATASQRTALEARGYACEVPGGGSPTLLELDHLRDWAPTRQTRLDDLAWLCPVHHDDKTYQGWQLTGPPHNRQWNHPQHQPP